MSPTLARPVIIFAVLAALWAGGVSAQSAGFAITNVTLIDGSGAPPTPTMTVIVNGGRIATIGRAGSVVCLRMQSWLMAPEGS
jgi:hypothetical protein